MNADDAMRASLAAVVPCYNAGGRVRGVVEGLARHVDHIIVVDDGSTDGCTADLDALGVQVVRFDRNRGKGFALLAGFEAALAHPEVNCAAVLDADGQHAPDELPRLSATFGSQHADLVVGSRSFELSQVPWRSRVGNVLTRQVTAWLLGRGVPDTQSGYRLHSRRLLEEILKTVPGGRYETEMEILVLAVRGPFTVVAVPIETIYEAGNVSSHFSAVRDSIRIYLRLLKAVWRHRPARRKE